MTARAFLLTALLFSAYSACDSTQAKTGADGGALGDRDVSVAGAPGAGGAPSDASSPPAAGGSVPVGYAVCGDVTCKPGTSSVQSVACCADSGACGLRIVLSAKCLEKKEPGGVDSRCAPFDIAGKITMPGCCSPSGCGALATFDDLGCIPNADLSRATVPCTPDVPFQ